MGMREVRVYDGEFPRFDQIQSGEEASMTARLANNWLTDEGTDLIRITGLGQNVGNIQ